MMHQTEASTDLQRALSRLNDDLERTSARYALGVEALLVSAGKVESGEALQWVNANLRWRIFTTASRIRRGGE